MEGNYGKVLEAQKDVPKMYYAFLMEKLIECVRHKVGERLCQGEAVPRQVGASLERSYENLPAQQALSLKEALGEREAAQMLILTDA